MTVLENNLFNRDRGHRMYYVIGTFLALMAALLQLRAVPDKEKYRDLNLRDSLRRLIREDQAD
jgi:hypothetical protein